MKEPSKYIIPVLTLLILVSCGKNPKVITADKPAQQESTGVFEAADGFKIKPSDIHKPHPEEDLHMVIIKETLPTSKYIYLKVEEAGKEFWIATNKTEVELGEKYFYRGGLLKTNFESKEHQRVFKKLYLVSQVVKANHGQTAITSHKVEIDKHGQGSPSSAPSTLKEGSIRIADLVNEADQYNQKTVQLSGTCTKVNANIMDRNWIHLKDGSLDDFDMVITTQTSVPVGHAITLRGTVSLQKDFGSGYFYDLIVENGEVVQ